MSANDERPSRKLFTPPTRIRFARNCGILMYVAVGIWRESKTQMGVVFAIPVFILSGYEHSIADMFYFSLAGTVFRPQSLLFLLLVVLGNSIGGLFIPFLQLLKGGRHG